MGVPAFYRWLSEKYPKVVLDVIEERVQVENGSSTHKIQFDSTQPIQIDGLYGNEIHNLYIDMNGIIHPCSHPEVGPQPKTEEEMYDNVCKYIDRLFRIYRPRSLLYLAIDGVAPRAKMNQQRSRRFRSAQEARELALLESRIYKEVVTSENDSDNDNDDDNNEKKKDKESKRSKPWDSNVITPGTSFMINLAEYVRFYIRKRISTDNAWKTIKVIFSDASIPGEGEHKIMNHIRLQRTCVGYNPNTYHVLHGLDADLIMLALATHEPYFYISREEVLFGRKSEQQKDQRQIESGHKDKQTLIDTDAGPYAMQLLENTQKPLQLLSIPILREYLAIEFHTLLQPNIVPFTTVTLERLIDDFVFMCFFVGNDFLPHLPSLEIRDGALDYLLNVYQRLLPSMDDYITKNGGIVNLKNVDILLSEIGSIEDYVFQMKYDNEQQDTQRKQEQQQYKKNQQKRFTTNNPSAPPTVLTISNNNQKVRGKAAKILENNNGNDLIAVNQHKMNNNNATKTTTIIQASHMSAKDNADAAAALKLALNGGNKTKSSTIEPDNKDGGNNDESNDVDDTAEETKSKKKRKRKKKTKSNGEADDDNDDKMDTTVDESNGTTTTKKSKKKRSNGEVGDAEEEFDADDSDDDNNNDNDNDNDEPSNKKKVKTIVKPPMDPVAMKALVKDKVKAAQQKQLDDYSKSVVDNVRLHESGWKDRYYTDKCKADDVEHHGGREHMFRSYVMGLCWVMKYYYDGVPSWKWYYPFHYGPFASDLKNIERFEKDCKSFQLNTPFNPVEQLMAVLPSDSAHAIPKPSRWLMLDSESPILDFYPIDVPVDPNGKAMPWLWVVLLPFIDEDRLLSAMGTTMKEWSHEEKLCNTRGLDEGYLYIHRTEHPLVSKVIPLLEEANAGTNKTVLTTKVRLTDMVRYGISGLVRPPLSNEIYPINADEDVQISLPSTARTAINNNNNENDDDEQQQASTHDDSIFTEPIYKNDAICVAFTEPPKLSHKSILLPGVKIPRPVLTSASDRHIRRPKLNRFGNTIAYLGGSNPNNNSHQSGYGSMNISQYERNIAQQNGRGNEMYQAGTRTWGSLEPTPKRFHNGNGMQQQQQQHNIPPPPPPLQQQPQNHHQQQQGFSFAGNHQQQQFNGPGRTNNGNGRSSRWGTAAPQQQQQQQGGRSQYQHPNHGYNNNNNSNYQQPQQQQQGYYNNNIQQQQPRFNTNNYVSPPPPPPPQQQQQRHGNYNNNNNNTSNYQQNRHGHGNQDTAAVMNSLRAQLSSTLSRNNQKNNNNNNSNNNRR